jgi:hypothetical protein
VKRRDPEPRGKQTSTRWVVCAALVASLWRGPVPWIHSHETDAHDHDSQSLLAWHLEQFHQQHPVAGWHIHLTFPWDVFHEPRSNDNPESPRPSVVYEMPFVVTPVLSTADAHADASPGPPANLLPECRFTEVLHSLATRVSGLHFMQTYPPRVALRALICVALC